MYPLNFMSVFGGWKKKMDQSDENQNSFTNLNSGSVSIDIAFRIQFVQTLST